MKTTPRLDSSTSKVPRHFLLVARDAVGFAAGEPFLAPLKDGEPLASVEVDGDYVWLTPMDSDEPVRCCRSVLADIVDADEWTQLQALDAEAA